MALVQCILISPLCIVKGPDPSDLPACSNFKVLLAKRVWLQFELWQGQGKKETYKEYLQG